MKKFTGPEKWDKDNHYHAFDIVTHNECHAETKVYISLVGGSCKALLSPENIGNNPFISPAHWSLLEIVE